MKKKAKKTVTGLSAKIEQEIMDANPVFQEPGFDAEMKKWTRLRDEDEAKGLTGMKLAAFIGRGMKKK